MTPREYRQSYNFNYDHFIELTQTGISPNYVNIELFAHAYHLAKLKLLGIEDVLAQKEQLCKCGKPEEIAYSPCCSLTCWCEQFESQDTF